MQTPFQCGRLYPMQLPDPKLKGRERPDRKETDYSRGEWTITDGEFVYQSYEELKYTRGSDPGTRLRYERPVFAGESVKIEFWWESGKTEIQPIVGGVRFKMSKKGIKPVLTSRQNDLATSTIVQPTKLDPPLQFLTEDVIPNEEAWNTFTLQRNKQMLARELISKIVPPLRPTDEVSATIVRGHSFCLMTSQLLFDEVTATI